MQGINSLYCSHLRTDKDRSNIGQSERIRNKKIYNVHSLIEQLKAKWASWTNQMAVPEKNGIRNCIFSLQKTYSVVDVFNKRHNSWLYVTCDSRTQLCITALNPLFFFLPRSRLLAAAPLCWTSCGLTLSCRSGAGWRTISDIECFHFGLFRAAWPAAAAAAAVMAAVFAPAWTWTVGPRLHGDNSAVVFGAEVRAVWRAVVRTWSG